MGGRILKELVSRCAEGVFSVALVVAFFLVLVGLLTLSLPTGISFGNLVRITDDSPLQGARSIIRMNLGRGPAPAEPIIATLLRTQRTVRNKPADAIAWSRSWPGMRLGDHEAVQTFDRSGATISFDQGNELSMGENSLIVIESLADKENATRRQASLVVFGGELNLRMTGKNDLGIRLASSSGATVVRAPGSQDQDMSLDVLMNEDGSSTFAIHEGTAEVTAGGRTVTVREHEAVTVATSRPPGAPEPLPPAPVLLEPAADSTFHYRSLPPEIRFSWSAENTPDAYLFELARDEQFAEIIHEERLGAPAFVHGNLGEGTYFWRLRSAQGELRSAESPSERFSIIKDNDAPMLDVEFPSGPVASERLILRGSAEPGCDVFIADQRIETSEAGRFEHDLKLQPGPNVVVVQAIDPAGNMTYSSEIVHAKY